ncbi:hypothetical protein ACYPKM_00550 [Pseudomonas aeruginosa]
MAASISVYDLFSVPAQTIAEQLKAQKLCFQVRDHDGFWRLPQYLAIQALMPRFQASFAGPYHDHCIKTKRCPETAWEGFLEVSYTALDGAGLKLNEQSALRFITKGLLALCTHTDRAAERPQVPRSRSRLAADFHGVPEDQVPQVGATFFAWTDGEAPGVTMPRDIQRRYGVVSTGRKGYFSAAGNAADTLYQVFFMAVAQFGDNEPATLLEHLAVSHLADLFFTSDGCSQEYQGESLRSIDFHRFMIALSVCVQYLVDGTYEKEWQELRSRYPGDLPDLEPGSFTNRRHGQAVSQVVVRAGAGYHRLSLLPNLGMAKDIHEAKDVGVEVEHPEQWHKMFSQVHFGGSNPQGVSLFYASIVRGGRANALWMGLSRQMGDHRRLRKQLALGRPIYYLSKDNAALISNRRVFKSMDESTRPITSWMRQIMRHRASYLVDNALAYLAAIKSIVDADPELSFQVKQPAGTEVARAERAILLGCAQAEEARIYAQHLQGLVFSKVPLTRAEKSVISLQIAKSLAHKLRLS